MSTRIKLAEAATQCAATPDGRGVRLWQALVLKHKYSTPTETDRERFVEIAIAILEQVRSRLEDGQWTAWGWLQGRTSPVRIPRRLFERDDVDIDFIGNRISCTVIEYDHVTVDAAMEGIPAVDRPQRIGAIGIIKPAFDAWVASLPEPPTQKQAKKFAKDRNFVEARVLDLWELLPKRMQGRPPKAK